MDGPVKRSYDTSGREAQSRDNRRAILAVARRLFLEHGYSATSMAAIARGAEVHVDTVYTLIGRKPELVAELIKHALSGSDAVVPAEQREYVAAIRAQVDPARKIEIYAAATRSMVERVAPLFVALRDAAGSDATARDLLVSFSQRRAANMREFVGDVAGAAGGLPDGMSLDDAADAVWATNSPELFATLTTDRGWTADRYERWLSGMWQQLLLA